MACSRQAFCPILGQGCMYAWPSELHLNLFVFAYILIHMICLMYYN